MTHVTSNTINAGFRLYDDDVAGAVTAQTALASANTNATIDTGTKFHAALRVTETAGADSSITPRLEYNLNGGGWNDVTASTPVQAVTPTNCTTSDTASYGTTALSNGATIQETEYSSAGSDGSFATLNNSSAELTTCLQIDSGQVSDGDTFQLRISNAGTALNADTTIVTVTVNVPAVTHATTGALVGQGAAVVGTAVHNIPHSTSGVLSAGSATITGSASRASPSVTHTTSGALVGQGPDVGGTAARFRTFGSSGGLVGQGSNVAGTANRFRAHDASGAVVGPGASLVGASTRFRAFDTSGGLQGQGANVAGSASRATSAATHDTTGALSGQGAALSGAAARTRQHATSGSIVAGAATITGGAQRFRAHGASGALVAGSATIAGSANRDGLPITHATSGALVATGAAVIGVASGTNHASPTPATKVSAARVGIYAQSLGNARVGSSTPIGRSAASAPQNRNTKGRR